MDWKTTLAYITGSVDQSILGHKILVLQEQFLNHRS
ncbi:MAG: hypothetical protein BMS9Abin37_2853 [Acidobacteriota bacterium]|nr:MAG: hypothetical protein BMS9Abin37_2853 [Acidobacteriota bacterium]